jgi:hypothetical protein
MLDQYKNTAQIQAKNGSVSAERLSKSKTNFLSFDADESIYFNPEISSQGLDSRTELHVYNNNTWITGNHSVQKLSKIPEYRDKITNQLITFPAPPVAIDLYNEFKQLNLTAGNLNIVVNFFKNLIGSYDKQHLRIDEISPDRTEIRLRAIDGSDPEFLVQITNYINTVQQTSSQFYKSYLLNFSRNRTVLFVNSVVISDYLYVKLYEALPSDIEVDFKCWVVEELKDAYIDSVQIVPDVIATRTNKLANPNWYANASYNISSETGLKNWNDLLGSSVQTSQQIVDAYFSGSLAGMKLNIDYSDFNNFVFYSSAVERLQNFRYKLDLLEYYTSQSLVVSQLSGSVATTNVIDYTTTKTNLVSGFDAFEQFLYYQSSSILTTYEIPAVSPNVAEVTGSYITPVPKSTSTYPYTLVSTTSPQFTTWFDNLIVSASLYDTLNLNALTAAIPEYIRFDSANVDLGTFVNMLGHHYDILYTYINHMSKTNKREENPKLGMPNELLYSVAKQFGWNLTDGNQYQDLWQYVLGTSETGTPLTGSISVGDPSVPGRDMTYTVWRRIVNNLPLLLKSKGTKRSVQALLSCYGIPQSMISINEYGGPRLDRAPVYEKLNFDYALDLIGTTAGEVSVIYDTTPKFIELRFRLDDVRTNPTIPSQMELIRIKDDSLYVTVDFVSGTLGTVTINSGPPSAPIEMFDGGWLSLLLNDDGTDSYAVVKRSKYGKIVAETSATGSGAILPSPNAELILGGTYNASRLKGELQELRLWNANINTYFDNHVKAPAAYNSANPYNELIFRLPLTQKVNHTLTGSLDGVQPKPVTFKADFIGWSTDTPYDSVEETYYYDSPSLGAGTFDDNKIRLESNELIGTLDVKTRAERSQFDTAALDSKKLGVYFSPQTMIDEDIIAQLGFAVLDNYIGDPGEVDSHSYPELIQVAQSYWKKYETRNDINAYINMFTLFDLSFFRQLEQLLPARVDKLTGILIKPNLLERSKDRILPKIVRENESYNSVIEAVSPIALGDYLQFTGSIDGKILDISGIDDDQWQMYLTASNADKYDGTTYSHEYLIRSGSTYITASTPYWISEALCPAITSSVISEFRYVSGSTLNTTQSFGITYGSGSYGTGSYAVDLFVFSGTLAEVQDFLPQGINNQRYSGAKMTSAGFNVNSTDTVDGGPVAEWRTANGNQLIYQTVGQQGSFVL